MAYQYPYGDTQQLNLAWFLDEFKALQEAWEQEKQGITGALDAEIARAEAALSGVIEARDQAAASAADALSYRNAAQSASQAAELSKTNAETARRDASNYAVSAAGSAQNASNSAIAAGNSATLAESAKSTAIQQANAAVQASGAASGYAQSAGQQAANAAASATAADGSATDAAGSATTAGEEADRAEAAADTVADSVTQIATNTSDISDLKESITQLKETQYSPYEEVTVTNVPVANLKDSAEDVPVKQAVFDIIARQTGTGEPSPSNIRPLTGFTSARIGRSTKNLMSKFNNMYRAYCYLPKGTTIYFRYFSETNFNSLLYGYDLAGNIKTIANCYSTTIESITLSEDFSQIYISTSASEQIDSYNGTIVVATEPFTESEPYADIYNIEFPTEANTVFGGKLDITTGKLTITHLKQTFPTTGWTDQETLTKTKRFSFTPTISMKNVGANNVADILCSQYPVKADASDTVHVTHRAVSVHAFVLKSDFPNATAWTTYLSNLETLPEIVYQLRDSIEYNLTPLEIKTLINTTIWADTGIVNTLVYRSNGNINNKILLLKAIIAPVLENMIADTALVVNDFRIVNNTLYRVTANIANGGNLTVGTNVVATTIADVLKSLLN